MPHAANQQHQQVGSTPPDGHTSSSGGGVGNNHKQQQQVNNSSSLQDIGAELIKASRQQPTRLAFVLELTATRDWRWEGVLWRGRLYLEVPSRLVQTGSKEGFVALLEYAEEELQCSHVVLALSKERADRADVIRTFMFLGFSVLTPGHQLVPANSNNLFLACSLE